MNTQQLLAFLDESPVNYLAISAMERRLKEHGYKCLDARERFLQAEPGDKFYVTKNGSALFAFHIGRQRIDDGGFHLICAHSDSPTFRIKPDAEIIGGHGMVRLNVELYGGAIMSTWFDRPLSLAGRVVLRSEDPMHPEVRLLHIKRPLLTIPNLAIHFNRQVNDGVKLSKQKDMLPVLGLVTKELEWNGMLLNVIADELGADFTDILDFDLYLYDTTPACRVGVHNEFISAGRLDDLSMVHAGLTALLNTSQDIPQTTSVLAIFDNEETGSQTKQGAGSPFLASLIERLVIVQGGVPNDFFRAVENAFMISADNAHAWHPNYSEKYDPVLHPMLGGGPVVKYNASQKYTSDAESAAVFMQLCQQVGVPCQRFVNHSDVAGGSTLGNILAGSLPLRGVDMGNPILGMHSIRELGAAFDHEAVIKVFEQFYRVR